MQCVYHRQVTPSPEHFSLTHSQATCSRLDAVGHRTPSQATPSCITEKFVLIYNRFVGNHPPRFVVRTTLMDLMQDECGPAPPRLFYTEWKTCDFELGVCQQAGQAGQKKSGGGRKRRSGQ